VNKLGRQIRNVFLVRGDAEDCAAHLREQGKDPRLYRRYVRAENMTIEVHVVCAKDPLAAMKSIAATEPTDLESMHCRGDVMLCRGETYCACQCDKCTSAWRASNEYYGNRPISALVKRKPRKT
jgi:hypothetical protein